MAENHWRLVALKEIATDDKYAVVGGPFGSKLVSRDYVPEGVPVLRGANLPLDREIALDDLVFVTDEKVEKDLFGNLAYPGDIIVTQRGTLGQIGLLPEADESPYGLYVVSQSQMKLTVDQGKADNRFVYYALRSPGSVKRIQDLGMSSGVPHINLDIFRNFEIRLPDLSTQRAVANWLGRYDDLIENNRRRVEILEEMARLIYREWFVHFRFPGHEDVELVDSDLGPIPDGWSVRTLDEVAEVNARTLRKADLPDEIVYIDISSVEPGRIGERSRLTADEAPGRARRVVVNGDVIWSTVRPNRQAHALVLNPEQGTIASTGLAVLSASSVPPSFLFEWSSTNEFTGYLISRATGSAYPAVRPTDFEEAPIVVPTDELLAEFDERVGPMHQLQATLSRQNEVLREARDLLLPRLVSGELDVSELDLEMAEVG